MKLLKKKNRHAIGDEIPNSDFISSFKTYVQTSDPNTPYTLEKKPKLDSTVSMFNFGLFIIGELLNRHQQRKRKPKTPKIVTAAYKEKSDASFRYLWRTIWPCTLKRAHTTHSIKCSLQEMFELNSDQIQDMLEELGELNFEDNPEYWKNKFQETLTSFFESTMGQQFKNLCETQNPNDPVHFSGS